MQQDGCTSISNEMKRPVRVIFVKLGMTIYGAEKATLDLVRHLDPKVVEVRFVVLEKNEVASEFLEALKEMPTVREVEVVRGGILRMVLKLRKILRKRKNSVCCTIGYKCNILTLVGTMGMRIPLIAYLHGWPNVTKRLAFYHWLDRLAVHFFSGIITVSKQQLSLLRKDWLGRSRVECIPNGVNCAELEEASSAEIPASLTLRKPFMIFVGRLEREKGLHYLIDAIKDSSGVPTLYVVGDGSERPELEKRVQNLMLEDKVLFIGQFKNVYRLMKEASFLILPSTSEAFPLVLLEAMGIGTPVIATRVGGVLELVTHMKNGLLVRPGDIQGLKEAMELLASSGDLRRTLAVNGKRKVENCHQLENVARRFELFVAHFSRRE